MERHFWKNRTIIHFFTRPQIDPSHYDKIDSKTAPWNASENGAQKWIFQRRAMDFLMNSGSLSIFLFDIQHGQRSRQLLSIIFSSWNQKHSIDVGFAIKTMHLNLYIIEFLMSPSQQAFLARTKTSPFCRIVKTFCENFTYQRRVKRRRIYQKSGNPGGLPPLNLNEDDKGKKEAVRKRAKTTKGYSKIHKRKPFGVRVSKFVSQLFGENPGQKIREMTFEKARVTHAQ